MVFWAKISIPDIVLCCAMASASPYCHCEGLKPRSLVLNEVKEPRDCHAKFILSEILRCAQNDRRRAQNDRRMAQNESCRSVTLSEGEGSHSCVYAVNTYS